VPEGVCEQACSVKGTDAGIARKGIIDQHPGCYTESVQSRIQVLPFSITPAPGMHKDTSRRSSHIESRAEVQSVELTSQASTSSRLDKVTCLQ